MRGPLTILVLAMVALLGVALVGVVVDPTVITGRPAWLKPAKFAVSTALYAGTLLWLLSFVRGHRRLVGLVSWGTTLLLFPEIAIIVGQAARGRTSHFNESTPLDAALFNIMGTLILAVWLLGILAAVLVLRQRMADRVLAAGLRAGLITVSVGMLSVVPLILNGGHTVGLPDGGPGLPIVGWSTVAGDLRPAHFLGLHGMQLLPVVGLLLSRVVAPWLPTGHRIALVTTAAAGHLGLVALLSWQGLRGQPIVAPDNLTLTAFGLFAATVAAIAMTILVHARLSQPGPRVAALEA